MTTAATAPSGRTVELDFIPMNEHQQKLLLVAATDLLVASGQIRSDVALSGPQILQFLSEAAEHAAGPKTVALEGAVVGGGLRDVQGQERRVVDLRVLSPYLQTVELIVENDGEPGDADANEKAAFGVFELRRIQPYVHVVARIEGGRLFARLSDVVVQP
jgi:hypothetical protein